MLAIRSCVILGSFELRRSRLSGSHRHNCWSIEWCWLHIAVWAIWVISACGTKSQRRQSPTQFVSDHRQNFVLELWRIDATTG
jgi:hypothetical protein